MANVKSAIKRARQSEERRQRNRSLNQAILTLRNALFAAAASGDREQAEKVLRAYCSLVDKAAKRNAIRKAAANRRKSRGTARVAAMGAPKAAS